MIGQCEWKRKNFICRDKFKTILTEDGICYTFNSLDLTDIYREERYTKINILII